MASCSRGKYGAKASIIGSQFTASYQRTAEGIIPTIRGEAWYAAITS